MAEVKSWVCPNCGSSHYSQTPNGEIKCDSCESVFPGEGTSNQDLADAVRSRNKMNFEDAIATLDNLIDSNESPEAHWQRLLSRYGVIYVNDKNEAQNKPTICRLSAKKVTEDNDYLKAVQLAKGTPFADFYKQGAEELEAIRSGAIEESKIGAKYDIFICYKKNDDKGNPTKDSQTARDIYDILVKKQYNVFFAEKSLKSIAGQDYEPKIYNALMSAHIMLVIASSDPSFLTSRWVKNEWSRFKAFASNPDEKKVLIPVLDNGFNPYNLPDQLQGIEALKNDAHFDEDFTEIARKYLHRGITSNLKKGPAIENEISPIDVAEVKIEKKSFGRSVTKVQLDRSSETALKDIRDGMCNLDKGHIYRQTMEDCQAVLQKDPNQPEAAWDMLLLTHHSGTDAELLSQFLYLFDKNDADYAARAIENFDKKIAMEKIDVLCKLSIHQLEAFNPSPAAAADIFSFLMQYLPDGDERNEFIDNFEEAMCKCISVSHRKISIAEINNIVNAVYQPLTAFGTEQIVNLYDGVGSALQGIERWEDSIAYYDKALALFKADSFALYNKICCDHKSNSFETIAKRIKTKNEIIDPLTTMLKGGFEITDDPRGNFELIRHLVIMMLDHGDRNLAIEIYKEIWALIPDTKKYKDYSYMVSITFPEILLLKGLFDEAVEFFKEVLSRNNYDFRAQWGLFKANHHFRSNYDVILFRKDLRDKFGDEWATLREAEEKTSDGKGHVLNDFHKWHDDIIEKRGKERSELVKKIQECRETCIDSNITPTLEWILKHNTFSEEDLINDFCNDDEEGKFGRDVDVDNLERVARKHDLSHRAKNTAEGRRLYDILLGIVPPVIGVILATMTSYGSLSETLTIMGGLTIVLALICAVIGFFYCAAEGDSVLAGLIEGLLIGAVAGGILLGVVYGLMLGMKSMYSVAPYLPYVISCLISGLPYLADYIIHTVKNKYVFSDKKFLVISTLLLIFTLAGIIVCASLGIATGIVA
jgi:tetratricopeptide (TPR) repeat protein